MKENCPSVLFTALAIACLDTSSGKTLIGVDKRFTVKEVLYIVGPKACRHACLRRSGCVDTIYEKELLMCKLLSASSSTIQNEDSTSKFCSSTICNSNELCVELSQRAKCVKIDMPRDCKDVLALGRKNNGIHVIFPASWFSIPVLCNMNLNGGGYTSVQRRLDGSINFQRDWSDYKHGFGDLESEFWIGNTALHALTHDGESTMYIALENHFGVKKYAEYISFKVDNSKLRYKLTWKGYNGTAGNSLMREAYFSTKDQDNDVEADSSCAISKGGSGGWWYKRCSNSALNGVYCSKGEDDIRKCNRWYTFNSDQSGMKMSEMLLRRN